MFLILILNKNCAQFNFKFSPWNTCFILGTQEGQNLGYWQRNMMPLISENNAYWRLYQYSMSPSSGLRISWKLVGKTMEPKFHWPWLLHTFLFFVCTNKISPLDQSALPFDSPMPLWYKKSYSMTCCYTSCRALAETRNSSMGPLYGIMNVNQYTN